MNQLLLETEIFEAARTNDVKKVRELLDAGVDVNLTDIDRGATALHLACSTGAKQVVELLVTRGADLNVRDAAERTPLHNLVSNRFDVLAMWLVSHGASLYVKDRRGFGPIDYALPHVQRELKIAAGELKPESKDGPTAAQPPPLYKAAGQQASGQQAQPSAPVRQEIMRVYMKNGSYKTVRVSSDMTASSLVRVAAEKFNVNPDWVQYLDLMEKKRDEERRITPGENLFDLKAKWPYILGPSGNETNLHCYFVLAVKTMAPDVVREEFAKLK
jgi:hypothetical protein